MRPFAIQDPNIISTIGTTTTTSMVPGLIQLGQKPVQQQQQQQQQQQASKYNNKRSFNKPISNKSNTQYQAALKHKNEITIKINKLSELPTHDEPKVYYTLTPVNFNQRDSQSISSNLPLINCKTASAPIRTRQFLLSTFTDSNNEINNSINNKVERGSARDDPIDKLIQLNQAKFAPLTFNRDVIKISEDGFKVEISNENNNEVPPSAKKRSIQTLEMSSNVLPQIKKKHRYDIPLENSRTISAKEVLRMVDSSLISSDMDLSQNNSTSTSMVLNDNNTPLKTIPPYLKIFNNNNNNNNGNMFSDTPLKNSISSSTPQPASKFLNIQDDELKCSPLNGSKLKNFF